MPYFQVDQIGFKLRQFWRRQGAGLVAIDGRGGAGKSTLAKELRDKIGAQIIEGDDFYRVMSETERRALQPKDAYMRNFDWQRLRDQVLAPIRNGKAARYEQYDWHLQQLGPAVQVEPEGLIIIEGVYSFRPELRPYYDYSVFVETSRDVCFRRLRDRHANKEEWIQRWAAAEDWYIEHLCPSDAADMIARGGDDAG
jgi:uridine kinase